MFKNRKILIPIVVFLVLVALAWANDFSIRFWDKLFLIGLFCFMVGGGFLLIKKGVFNNIMFSFRLFFKKTSKLERYVSETSDIGTTEKTSLSLGLQLTYYLIVIGMLLITVSTIFSILLF